MPKPITAKVFQTSLDQKRFPEQDRVAAKRLVNVKGEHCFVGLHKLGGHNIPAIYLALGKKSAGWASNADGMPLSPDFRFIAITASNGDVGIECLLRYPGQRHLHLFLNPGDPAVKNFLRLLAKSEIIGLSYFFQGADMVYASYSSSDPDIQAWATRNLGLAKKVGNSNDISKVMDARRKMFWLRWKRKFVGEG